MTVSPLPALMLEPIVRAALLEDLGRAGDVTTDAIVPASAHAETALVARQPGIVAGLDLAATAFRLIEPAIEIRIERPDGTRVAPGDRIATLSGPTRGMLTAERVALNFLGHLSGVATATATLVEAVERPQGAHLLHAQDDARPARRAEIRRARRRRHQPPLRPRRCRADQGQPCRRGRRRARRRSRRREPASATWSRSRSRSIRSTSSTRRWRPASTPCCSTTWAPTLLAEAVRMIDGRAIAEASGRITPATAPAIAAAGVDLISAGWLTHSASVLDIGLDWRH